MRYHGFYCIVLKFELAGQSALSVKQLLSPRMTTHSHPQQPSSMLKFLGFELNIQFKNHLERSERMNNKCVKSKFI